MQTTVRTIYSLEVECRPLTEAGTPVPPASGEAVNAADGKHGEQVQQAQSASGEMLNAAAGESDEQVQQAQPESGETAIPAAGGVNAGSADQLLTIRVKGNGFLYNMVRIIAGTLVEVGRGHIKPEEVAGIIAAKDRAKARTDRSGKRTAAGRDRVFAITIELYYNSKRYAFWEYRDFRK